MAPPDRMKDRKGSQPAPRSQTLTKAFDGSSGGEILVGARADSRRAEKCATSARTGLRVRCAGAERVRASRPWVTHPCRSRWTVLVFGAVIVKVVLVPVVELGEPGETRGKTGTLSVTAPGS